jgi:hypothetical protein
VARVPIARAAFSSQISVTLDRPSLAAGLPRDRTGKGMVGWFGRTHGILARQGGMKGGESSVKEPIGCMIVSGVHIQYAVDMYMYMLLHMCT